MDLFTHALLGATVARAAAPDRAHLQVRERLFLGAAAAAFPDIDFVGFPVNPLAFLADWHQGPTHSVVLLPLWAVLIAGLYVILTKRNTVFGEAVVVSGLGLASHIAADLITVYGTMVLYPLSRWRPGIGTTFVIDPVFTTIILAGLAGSIWDGRRRVAGAALIVLTGYVTGQALLQQRALEIGRASALTHGFSVGQLSALPQPFSPFNWKLIAGNGMLHREAYVNLIGHASLVPPLAVLQRFRDSAAAFRPPAQLDWQERHLHGDHSELRPMIELLWADPRLAPFRRFASHPSLSGVEHEGGVTCVWFTDLRYNLPALPGTFRFGFCRADVDQHWELYRLRYFSQRDRQRIE